MNYCPYCVANESPGGGYACGTVNGTRSRTCLESEIAVLRADKEQAFSQAYDLEWQRNQYARVIEVALENREVLPAALDEAITTCRESLGIPFRERDDELTHDYLARTAARRARYS